MESDDGILSTKEHQTKLKLHESEQNNSKLNLPFPHSETFVIWRWYKSSVLVDKCDGVDCTKMSVIFLHNLTGPYIPLKHYPHDIISSITNATYSFTLLELLQVRPGSKGKTSGFFRQDGLHVTKWTAPKHEDTVYLTMTFTQWHIMTSN